ncbi:MAG TPA: hypothetical protein VHT29_01595 [Solirubrobacteraceae bacterium]|nr:hypothetical protein [Solirubrobacteraceae bacterium]
MSAETERRGREPSTQPVAEGSSGGSLPLRGIEGWWRSRRGGRAWEILPAVVLVLLVGGPMFFTRAGYSEDFTNSLWLIWVAGHHFGHTLWPSFFLNVEAPGGISGVFNPEFAFYGGPLYTATGALSAILSNHAAVAYAIVTAAALAAAYGGCWWLARQCGVRGLLAHVPAVVMLTGSYYSTDLYGRGAWSEFVAVSSIPLMAASAASLLRAGRWRISTVLLLVISTATFTGSHNITLEWGGLVLAVGVVSLLLAYRPRVSWHRVLAVVCLALLAAGVNGWYLLPDVAYAGHTVIAGSPFNWSYTSFFDTPGVLFYPLREVPSQSSTPALFVQVPLWFMLWSAVAAAWLWRDRAMARLRRAWVLITLGIIVVLLLLFFEWPWERMPRLLRDIQFTYRLGSYILLLTVVLVTITVLALQRLADRPGRLLGSLWSLRTLLVQAVLFSLILCAWQLWAANTTQTNWYRKRDEALVPVTTVPTTWYSGADYADNSLPIVSVPNNRTLNVDPRLVDAAGNGLSAMLAMPAGMQPVATNIVSGPYLVHVDGLHVLGRTEGNRLVVSRMRPGGGDVKVTVTTRVGGAVLLGRIVTTVSALGILLLLAWLGWRGWLERRGVASPRV